MNTSDATALVCRSPRTAFKPISSLGMLVALAIALCATGCKDDPVPLEDLHAMQARGAFEETLEPLRQHLAERPDDPELNYLYGGALLRTGSPDRAIWAIRKAATDPRWEEAASIQLGTAAIATREWANAITIATKILDSNPDSEAALLMRGNARLEEKSDYEAALDDFESLIELNPQNVEAQAARVAALIAVGRVEDAADALDVLTSTSSMQTAPPGVRARICTVAALFASERRLEDEAERRFAECLEAHPLDSTVLESYVSFLDDGGRFDEARALLLAAVERSPDNSALRIGLARRLILNEHFEQSEALLREGTERPNPWVASDAWATLADHYVALQDPGAAADAYRKSLEQVATPTAHQQLTLGDILARANRNDEAMEIARAIDNEVYRGLIEARVMMNRGDPEAALAVLDTVLPRWPNNPGARYWAARAAEQLGRFDRAVEEYRQAVRSGPGFTDAGVRLARLRLAESSFEDAWNAVNRFIDERPNDPHAARILMRIATLTGPETRLRVLTQQLASRPSWPDAVAERARTIAALTTPERGLDTLRVASGLDLTHPVNSEALRALVDLLLDLERGEEALAAIDEGLAKAPDSARFLELRGRVMLALDRAGEAVSATTRAIEGAPRDGRAREAHGLALLARGELEAALEAFAEARRLDPGLVTAYTAPGRALAEAGGRRADALDLWRALLAERPEHTGAALTLGRAQLRESEGRSEGRNERLAEALALAERAERFGGGKDALALRVEVLEALGAQGRADALRARLDSMDGEPERGPQD